MRISFLKVLLAVVGAGSATVPGLAYAVPNNCYSVGGPIYDCHYGDKVVRTSWNFKLLENKKYEVYTWDRSLETFVTRNEYDKTVIMNIERVKSLRCGEDKSGWLICRY